MNARILRKIRKRYTWEKSGRYQDEWLIVDKKHKRVYSEQSYYSLVEHLIFSQIGTFTKLWWDNRQIERREIGIFYKQLKQK